MCNGRSAGITAITAIGNIVEQESPLSYKAAYILLAGALAFGSYAVAGESTTSMGHMTMAQRHSMMRHCMEHQKAMDGHGSMSHMKMVCKKQMKMHEMRMHHHIKMQQGHMNGMRDNHTSQPPK